MKEEVKNLVDFLETSLRELGHSPLTIKELYERFWVSKSYIIKTMKRIGCPPKNPLGGEPVVSFVFEQQRLLGLISDKDAGAMSGCSGASIGKVRKRNHLASYHDNLIKHPPCYPGLEEMLTKRVVREAKKKGIDLLAHWKSLSVSFDSKKRPFRAVPSWVRELAKREISLLETLRNRLEGE